MRLFIAFKTTPFEDELYPIVMKIKEKIGNVKYVGKDNLHLTVKFLGEVKDEKVKEVNDFLNGSSFLFGKFKFKISGVGGFPLTENARVLFFNVIEGAEKMREIARFAEKGLSRLGFEEEGKFTPHITFGRAKTFPVNLTLVKVDDFLFEHEVIGLSLFQSVLTPSGAIYKELSHFEFVR
ncbi:MAG: RNA 2',3'-cyclic phosphodiesterase [Fervidobacterium sp.]